MFGEIQVNIGGQARTMRFGLNADFEHCKLLKMTLNQLYEYRQNGLNVENIRDRVYCALLVSDLKAGTPVTYNKYDVGDWLDELPEDDVMKIIEAMSGANVQGTVKKKG